MSKILIVSDSHGSTEMLEELKLRHQQEVNQMIHCGDSELTDNHESINGYIAVKGNCDFYGDFPEEVIVEVAEYKILVVHGHLYSVKSSLLRLSYRAEELGANIVCFGHSHLLGAEMIKDVLFINPGSVRLPRGRRERTYVILELTNQKALLHVYDIDRGKLDSLTEEFSVSK
ncbi:metallophosphoesterase [Bacillus sp. B15-48]|uniref:metallophosphoesterase family protein n=1 Tax=Bacillus sp. B15-48 TaxID=1548601 RepID=UPI00193F7CCD|nr:metallophosphoesterase [Bacillus sp. B15-48]MBM4762478.1 YfcE family phosphodiesterase [Bacillus sp. B15-48]